MDVTVQVAKRFSALFLGEAVACECGTGGAELTTPHECPKMGDTPDLVTSHGHNRAAAEREKREMLISAFKHKPASKLITVREDPHRRSYKRLVSITFLSCTSLYLVLDLSFQVE